jgi:hypothetical protein
MSRVIKKVNGSVWQPSSPPLPLFSILKKKKKKVYFKTFKLFSTFYIISIIFYYYTNHLYFISQQSLLIIIYLKIKLSLKTFVKHTLLTIATVLPCWTKNLSLIKKGYMVTGYTRPPSIDTVTFPQTICLVFST